MILRYKPHTPRLKIVHQYIRALFRDELPDGIKYHDADHTLHPTKGVVAVANSIAISENISEHDRELLIAAAYFHDTGYIREYDKNEPIAARMAGRILKLIGYSGCQKNVPVFKRFFLQPLIPQFRHSEHNYGKRYISQAKLKRFKR